MTNQDVAVLLTGRGNNTLKDKNVLSVCGAPLLTYTANAGRQVPGVTAFFASSEDKKILDAAKSCGYTPIKRPKKFAQPDSQHVDCLIHALDVMKNEYGVEPNILIVLLANCATVKTEWINDCVELIRKNPKITSVIPVQKNNDHHPLRAKKIDSEGFLAPFLEFNDTNISSNRQDLEPNYFVCHNFWVLNLSNMSPTLSPGQVPWPFMGDRIMPYVVDYSLDVHHEEDLYLTEAWLNKTIRR